MPFDDYYASVYDLFYDEVSYSAVAARLYDVFDHSAQPVKCVLDLGCGTGRYAKLLAEQGYEICGVDRSAAMIAIAMSRVPGQRWIVKDIADLVVDDSMRADAAIMMGDILSYHLSNSELLRALRNIRLCLTAGQIFVFDFWYGPAVLTLRPGVRSAEKDGVVRIASGELCTSLNLCRVKYKIFNMKQQKHSEETHYLRYFSLPELDLFLQQTGFTSVGFGTLANFDQIFDLTRKPSDLLPTESNWHAVCVANAI